MIQYDIQLNGLAIGGARLSDSPEFNFNSIIDIKPMAIEPKAKEEANGRRLPP